MEHWESGWSSTLTGLEVKKGMRIDLEYIGISSLHPSHQETRKKLVEVKRYTLLERQFPIKL